MHQEHSGHGHAHRHDAHAPLEGKHPDHASHDHTSHDHDHDHDHKHGHAHGGHHHHGAHTGSGYALGFALNLAFVLIEGTAGILTNSLALLADAGHNLSDLCTLGIAWTAAVLSRRRPSTRYTYGLRGSSIWAALINALLLVAACGAITWEAVQRLANPTPVHELTVMAVAAIGVVINTATALMFMRGRHDDLNRRGVFLHMAGDAAVSLGVVVAGALMLWTGWLWLDAAASLAVVAVIAVSTWGLLKDSIAMALHAVPPGINPGAVSRYLATLPGVTAIHDLHIWGMSTAETALTVHLVVPGNRPGDAFYCELSQELEKRFGIHHSTVQVERGDADNPCRLAPEDVV
jgi:cobalt-zinc-cadmium efflux system protein